MSRYVVRCKHGTLIVWGCSPSLRKWSHNTAPCPPHCPVDSAARDSGREPADPTRSGSYVPDGES